MNEVRLEATVSGRVQGVGFRRFVWKNATMRGLKGEVWNSESGSVMIVVEGESSRVDELLEALREGPRFATVTELECNYDDVRREYNGFSIR